MHGMVGGCEVEAEALEHRLEALAGVDGDVAVAGGDVPPGTAIIRDRDACELEQQAVAFLAVLAEVADAKQTRRGLAALADGCGRDEGFHNAGSYLSGIMQPESLRGQSRGEVIFLRPLISALRSEGTPRTLPERR